MVSTTAPPVGHDQGSNRIQTMARGHARGLFAGSLRAGQRAVKRTSGPVH